MNRTSLYSVAVLVSALLLGGVSCGDEEPVGPVAATLAVMLETPNQVDGALMLSLTGPIPLIEQFRATNPAHVLFFDSQSPTSLHALVAADMIGSGSLLEFEIPDVADAGQFRVTLAEVADVSNQLRSALATSDYSLDVSITAVANKRVID